eukprot:scpid57087/ scgid18098/ 
MMIMVVVIMLLATALSCKCQPSEPSQLALFVWRQALSSAPCAECRPSELSQPALSMCQHALSSPGSHRNPPRLLCPCAGMLLAVLAAIGTLPGCSVRVPACS